MTQTRYKPAEPGKASPGTLVRSRPPLPGTARPGHARPAAVLAVVLTGQFMAVLDASVVNVAAPSIHAVLHASGAALQLVIAGYTIAYAVLLVTGARVGDLLGHKRVFLGGLVAFTAASLGCGLAATTAELVALRFVQGIGAAAMIPQVLSLIQRTFSGSGRARAMSAYSAVLALGAVVGQVAGGVLVSANLFGTSWRPVFLVNVPIGAALVAAGWRMLPASAGEPGRGLDLRGVLILIPAVLAVVVPLVLGQPEHWPTWGWFALAAAVVLFGWFALSQRSLEARGGSPLVPGKVLGLAGMRSGVIALFAVMAVFGGMFFTLALHLQGGLGESPLRAGLTFGPAAAAFAAVSLNWQRLPAWSWSWLPVGGFAVMAAGLAAMGAALDGGSRGGIGLYLALAGVGAGMASAFSPLMTSVLMTVPVSDAADATGVIVTVNQLAIVVGVASFGALYLNLAGALPAAAAGSFRALSVPAEVLTCLVLASVAAGGGMLAAWRARSAAR